LSATQQKVLDFITRLPGMEDFEILKSCGATKTTLRSLEDKNLIKWTWRGYVRVTEGSA
jgi:hypothetical protein